MTLNCEVCQIKLRAIMIQMYTCRCKKYYCTEHINNHNCTVKYKHEHQDKVICKKINQI